MNLLRSLHVVFFVALFPHVASAIAPDPCFGAGQALVLPGSPSSNDPIGVTLLVASTFSSLLPHPAYQHYWFKQTAVSGDTFAFDVILTNDTTTFRGYTLVGKDDQNWGFIGPLPAGSYTLLGTVNVYDPSTGKINPQCDPAVFGPTQKVIDVTVWSTDDPDFQRFRTPEARLVEFYSPSRDDYFLTMDATEMQTLDNTPGWERTGEQFFAYVTGPYDTSFTSSRGTTNVARYYGLPSAGLNTHFYTFGSSAEVSSLSPSAWVREVNEFAIRQPLTSTGFCPTHTLPVYRLWNGRTDAHHRWTISPDIRREMVERGWRPEGYGPNGVVMCSPTV